MAREQLKTKGDVAGVEEPSERQSQVKRAPTGRYQLQIDRQTKSSYQTSEEAEAAGLVIKRQYPIVQVSVYDSVDYHNILVEIPAAAAGKE